MEPPDPVGQADLPRPYQLSAGGSGLTLVELLIVVLILAILAGVVVFAVGGITNNAGTSASASDKQEIVTAEEAYAAEHSGKYVDQATLVSADFLHQISQFWTVSVAPDGSSYILSPLSAGGSQGGACLTGQSLLPAAVRRQSTGPPGPLVGSVLISVTTNSGCAPTVTAKFTPNSGTQTLSLTGSGTSWSHTIGASDYSWAPGQYLFTISAGSDSGTVTLTVCSAPQATCP